MKKLQTLLQRLATEIAISGYEWKGMLPSTIQSVTQRKGKRIGDNLIFTVGSGKKKIFVSAHMDEVGFFVTKVEKDFVRIMPIGGIDVTACVGKKLIFLTNNGISITETIKPANSFAELKVFGLKETRIGDVGTFQKNFKTNDDSIIGPSLDNKVGCLALIEVLRQCKRSQDKTIIFCFASREEMNINGLMQAVKRFDPNLCIDIDSAYAQPMLSAQKKNWQIPIIGKGPAIQLMGKGFIIGKDNREKIEKIAKENDVLFQYEIPDGANGGTNASTLMNNGYDVMQINIPVANQHTAESKASIKDIQMTSKLITNLLESL
jgi:tetrahedral aminopeptidase